VGVAGILTHALQFCAPRCSPTLLLGTDLILAYKCLSHIYILSLSLSFSLSLSLSIYIYIYTHTYISYLCSYINEHVYFLIHICWLPFSGLWSHTKAILHEKNYLEEVLVLSIHLVPVLGVKVFSRCLSASITGIHGSSLWQVSFVNNTPARKRYSWEDVHILNGASGI
jgi:hypothetical protein